MSGLSTSKAEPAFASTLLRRGVGVTPGRILSVGLGCLWLIAGLLQAQPGMFGPDFYAIYPANVMPSTLQSVASGQPHFLQSIMIGADHLWGAHPVLFNLGAVLIQSGIGLGLLFFHEKGIGRVALFASLIWSAVVWLFGEGLGGILSGDFHPLQGGPGAVLWYFLASLMLVSRMPLRRLLSVQAIFWMAAGVWRVWPGNGYWHIPAAIDALANAAALPQPAVVSAPVSRMALWGMTHPFAINALIVAACLVVGVLLLARSSSRSTLALVMVWLMWVWWFCQDFGGVFSGMGTDLNSAAALGLLTVVGYVAARAGKEIEHVQG